MSISKITERLERTDRAVSPVIGVILMVAITVILAAVIGTFVLDLGQSAGKSAPSASLTVSAETGTDSFTISHKGGDTLQSESTTVIVTNESNGDTYRWESANQSVTLGVGSEANVSIATTHLDFDGSGNSADYPLPTAVGTFPGVDSGIQYSVQIVDTESQRVIFETTITA